MARHSDFFVRVVGLLGESDRILQIGSRGQTELPPSGNPAAKRSDIAKRRPGSSSCSASKLKTRLAFCGTTSQKLRLVTMAISLLLKEGQILQCWKSAQIAESSRGPADAFGETLRTAAPNRPRHDVVVQARNVTRCPHEIRDQL